MHIVLVFYYLFDVSGSKANTRVMHGSEDLVDFILE